MGRAGTVAVGNLIRSGSLVTTYTLQSSAEAHRVAAVSAHRNWPSQHSAFRFRVPAVQDPHLEMEPDWRINHEHTFSHGLRSQFRTQVKAIAIVGQS